MADNMKLFTRISCYFFRSSNTIQFTFSQSFLNLTLDYLSLNLNSKMMLNIHKQPFVLRTFPEL